MDKKWTKGLGLFPALLFQYTSPRILNLILVIAFGKPPEHIQQEGVVFIMHSRKNTDAQDADVIDAEQKSLPEGEEE